MPISFTNFNDGDPMTRAAVKTELDRMRNFLNKGFVPADIAAEAINETHIYRPETYGFPVDGTQSVFGEMYERHHGNDGPSYVPIADILIFDAAGAVGSPPGDPFWKTRQDRESIFMSHLDTDEAAVVPGTGCRISIDATGDLDVTMGFSATTQYDAKDAAALYYPEAAGYFVLVYRNVGTGVAVDGLGSRRDEYARYVSNGGGGPVLPERHHQCTHETGMFIPDLGPGLYDIYLEYRRDGADTTLSQIVVSVRNIVIEFDRT
ncbi:MAG: hypothetical protein KAI25_00025 [Hyphomicrobiaceae bacterium]|nr:hypothetical protein [Hyphomicrobiaceae bacterium]